jgi:hypothetical protein
MAKVWKKLQRADSAFTGDVTGTINGAAASAVKSGSALGTSSNQDSTSTIRSGTTKADVGLSNVADESRATILAGTFTGDVGGTSAADIRTKAIAGSAAKDAVDGNASVTMVGGSINIGSGEWTVDSSGNQITKGTITINKDSGGDAGLTLDSGSSGDMQIMMQGANPAIDLGGTAPLGTSTITIRRAGTGNQARVFFRNGTTAIGCIGFANQPSAHNDQFAIHTNAIYDSSSPYEIRNFTMDADNKIGFYANDKTFAGVTIDTDGTNKGLYVASGGIKIDGGSANWNATTPGTNAGGIHLDPGVATDHFGSAITFGASDSGNGETAQAGIYTVSDSGYGTKMYLATTGSYSSGSMTALTLSSDQSATFAGTIGSGAITSTAGISGTTGTFSSTGQFGNNLTITGGVLLCENASPIKAKNTSGTYKQVIGINSSDLVEIDGNALGATFAGDMDVNANCKVVGGLGIGTANTNAGHLVVKNSVSAGEILIGSDDKPVKGGWHSATKIFITPADFIVNDDNSYYNVALLDNGGELKAMTSALEAYCNFTIPDGYKAVSFRLNGTGSVGIGAFYSDVTTATSTSCQPPSSIYTNIEYDFYSSAVVSTTNGRYIILKWSPSSTSHRLYGGYIIIEPS